MASLEQREAFWAEMSACEHFVQIYEAEETFISTLANFVNDGLNAGHAVVVIATPTHRRELGEQLIERGHDLAAVRADEQLILLDVEETIAKFMIDGWPDGELFTQVVADILKRAGRNGRKVRAFGEMVAVMWAQGQCAATIRLEYLWHQLCDKHSFSLFCAYPKIGFTENASEAIAKICAAHSKVLV